MAAVFESYWASGDFVPYDADAFVERRRLDADVDASLLLARSSSLRPFQERLLELHRALPRAGPPPQPAGRCDRHRQDGDGRARLRAAPRPCAARRLLFVAHREEILEQSLATFGTLCAIRASASCGSAAAQRFEHVFASIQSLNASGCRALDRRPLRRGHHRRVSPRCRASYAALLEHLSAVELLGLTATPERADGLRPWSGSMTGSPRSFGCGTRSTNSDWSRSCTSESTTGLTCVRSRGAAGGATTSTL